MFIVMLDYKAPLTEIDKYLRDHREFLEYHYKQGLFLASGPLKPRTGGVIIALTEDRPALEAVLKADPFYMAELSDYRLFEFTPVKHREEIKDLILKTEGKLC